MSTLLQKALRHKEVYPLLGIVGFAAGFSLFCAGRACLTYPDIVWDHKTNPTPWLDIKQTEQKKMYKTHDYMSSRTEFPEVPK